jgi:peroxiredoxin
MEQVVDLQNSDEFKAMDVEIVSIARDPASEQAPAAQGLGITVPMLIDANGQVATQYDVMKYAMANGEPSHTFVLVNANGEIAWLKDYGAPDNPNRTMYVEINELYREVKETLEN